jgi:hypothetical protein
VKKFVSEKVGDLFPNTLYMCLGSLLHQ